MRIEGISAEINIIRSSRKTLSAQIRSDGTVTVRSPLRLPEREIIRFLLEKRPFIEKSIREAKEQKAKTAALPPLTDADIRALAEKALQVIPPRVAYFAQRIGVKYGRITVRNQKTRWGSCSGKGNLNFNCLLMLAPPDVLDSVIVHELCHLIHPNHSKAFYDEVHRAFPDYDRCDQWLKENGGILIARMTNA